MTIKTMIRMMGGGEGREGKTGMMDRMMPRMMENCLTSMNEEQRRKMLTFCSNRVGEMKERFLTSTQKGEANS